MSAPEPPRSSEQPASEEAERKRRIYDNAALAQSFAPEGVADLLRERREANHRDRVAARALPLRVRLWSLGILVWNFACLGVLAWALLTGHTAVALIAIACWIGPVIAVVPITIASERRKDRARA